jgi:hypothetical protein
MNKISRRLWNAMRIQERNQKRRRHNISANQTLGGWAVGQVGAQGTIYQNFTLAGGEDFDALDLVGPWTPKAKWFPTGAYHAATIRNNNTSLGMSYDADPLTTGHLDSNRGVPVGFNNMSIVEPSVVRLLARNATALEQAHFSPTDAALNGGVRPQITAMLHSAGAWSYFNTTVPVLVSMRVRLSPKTTNPRGSHISLWDYCATPPTATVGDERDIECTSQGMYHEYIPHSVAGTTLSNGSYDYLDGQFHVFDFVFVNGSTTKLYIDGVLKSSLATDSQKAGQPNAFILSNHIINGFNGDPYNATDWLTKVAYLDVDYIRFAYDTASGKHWKPLVTLPDVNVDYAGTTSIVLPDAATLFGDATATLDVQVMPYDVMEPGLTTTTAFSRLPAGWSWNAGARTISIDYSAAGGNAGRSHVVVYGFKTDTAFVAEPIRFCVNRGPNIKLSTLEPVPDGAGGLVCDVYAAADFGYIFNAPGGPAKQFSFTGLPTGWSYNPATYKLVSATAAVAGGTVTMTVTNGAGQSASKSVDLWSPAMTGSAFTWDTTSTASLLADGSALRDIYDSTKKIAQSTSANRPLVITTGGVSGNKRVLSYIANGIALRSDDAAATNTAGITSFMDTSDVRTGNRYIAFATKVSATGVVDRVLGWFNTAGTQFAAFRYTTTNRGAQIQGAGGTAQAADQVAQDASWHVFEIIKTAAVIVVKMDGVQIATVTVTQTGGITSNLFILGGAQAGGAFIGQIGPGMFTQTLPSTADQTRARKWVAGKMGITVS